MTDHADPDTRPADASDATGASEPAGLARPRRRRSWMRIIGLPLVIVVVAFMLQNRAIEAEARRIEVIERDTTAFVRTVVAGQSPGPGVMEQAAAGMRRLAADNLVAIIPLLQSRGWDVEVVPYDDRVGPATHRAVVFAGEDPVASLKVAVDDRGRSVLCGIMIDVEG